MVATTANIATFHDSNINVGGSILVNTNKFIIASATGNTTIDGTLDVAGESSLTAAQMSLRQLTSILI